VFARDTIEVLVNAPDEVFLTEKMVRLDAEVLDIEIWAEDHSTILQRG
jgi:hypothetical protein